MKMVVTFPLIWFIAVFVIPFSTSLERYYPYKEGKCDFRCANLKTPICASNGQCYHRFQSQCFLDHFNCNHGISPTEFKKEKHDSKCNVLKLRCSSFYYNYSDYFKGEIKKKMWFNKTFISFMYFQSMVNFEFYLGIANQHKNYYTDGVFQTIRSAVFRSEIILLGVWNKNLLR